jgi:alpha-glucosidase
MIDPDWWRGAVIYQVYPRSFQDSNGDGIGDLPGITRRLEHIASLGIDAVWIAPFFKSPMADMGYDVSDYRDVDPMFGTLADFDALLARAHELGLRVIIDQVLNHTSDQHEWFKESRTDRTNPKADWYVWTDPKRDGTGPNNWLSIFGGTAWEWVGKRRQYYMHSFLASQPDLNFHNAEVQDAVLDAARFWLDRGVDGFRLDACNHYFHDEQLRDNPPLIAEGPTDMIPANPYVFQNNIHNISRPENLEFMSRFRTLLNEYPGTVAVGEVAEIMRGPDIIEQYTSGNERLNFCYTFDLFGADFSGDFFRAAVTRYERAMRDGWVCWTLSNHDITRQISRFAGRPEDRGGIARLCPLILAALRGSICLYQGEELGLPEAKLRFEDLRDPYGIRFWPASQGRDGCRTPMPWESAGPAGGFTDGKPWLPVSDEHRALAVDAQETDSTSILHHYRAAIAFRQSHPVLISGELVFPDAPRDILAVHRSLAASEMLCVFNMTAGPQRWQLPEPFAHAAIDPFSIEGAAIDKGHAILPPWGHLFLVREGS